MAKAMQMEKLRNIATSTVASFCLEKICRQFLPLRIGAINRRIQLFDPSSHHGAFLFYLPDLGALP